MRRTTKAGAAVASLALLLAACSSGDDTATTDTASSSAPAVTGGELVIWADETRTPVLQPLCEEWATANGVTCTVVQKDYAKVKDDFKTQGPAGKGPDLIVYAHDAIGDLVQSGLITEVDLGAKASEFVDVAVKAMNFEGKSYGMPYAVENIALLTNKELSPECPATMEDLTASAEAMIADKKSSKGLGLGMQVGTAGDAYHWHPLYTAGGGYIFGTNPDGSYNPQDMGVGGEGSIAAAEKLAALEEAGVVSASQTQDIAKEAFNTGKLAWWITGPWNVTPAVEAGVDLQVCPVPTWADGQTSSPMVGVQAMLLSAFSTENKVIAQTFLNDYVATEAFQDAMYAADPRPPALTASLNKVTSDPIVAGFVEYGKQGIPQPNIVEMAAVWAELGLAEVDVLNGKDPAETMTTRGENITTQIESLG
jgi:arabinogalactan oligomer / maltooligosaccharide transport system substrate-binding protein